MNKKLAEELTKRDFDFEPPPPSTTPAADGGGKAADAALSTELMELKKAESLFACRVPSAIACSAIAFCHCLLPLSVPNSQGYSEFMRSMF